MCQRFWVSPLFANSWWIKSGTHCPEDLHDSVPSQTRSWQAFGESSTGETWMSNSWGLCSHWTPFKKKQKNRWNKWKAEWLRVGAHTCFCFLHTLNRWLFSVPDKPCTRRRETRACLYNFSANRVFSQQKLQNDGPVVWCRVDNPSLSGRKCPNEHDAICDKLARWHFAEPRLKTWWFGFLMYSYSPQWLLTQDVHCW